ncbi:MAG: hypothetical protein EBR81_16910, partial [Proteobacteria bacterium]|nr:hypothetical protein [Pseudomonadota bacterium]
WGNNTLGSLAIANTGGTAAPAINLTFATPATSTTVSGSSTITVGTTAGIVVGGSVSGNGIPTGATVAAVSGTSTIVISSPATAAGSTVALTFGGSLTLGGGTITAQNDIFGLDPIINSGGFLNASGGTLTVNATGLAPRAVLLSSPVVNGSLWKTGSGGMQLSATGIGFTGLNVVDGLFQLGGSNILPAGSTFNLGNTATFDLNSQSAFVSSLSGSGRITASSGTPTLTFGTDNTSTTFGGQFAAYARNILNSLSVTKIGTGTVTLTGVSDTLGTFNAFQGNTILSGSGSVAFGTSFIYNGALTLDNSATNMIGRLGGATKNLTLAGAQFNLIGNSLALTSESVSTLNIASVPGGSTITLTAQPGAPTWLSAATFTGQAGTDTGLIRGTNLGSTPGNGV